MNYKILPSAKIDAHKWNACIARYDMDIYNEYHFLNAICLNRWFAFIWGDYEKILPYYQKKKWGVIPYICMPPFCQKFDNRLISKEDWKEVFSYLKKRNVKIDYSVVDAKGMQDGHPQRNFILDKVQRLSAERRANCSSLVKKNLEKAIKHLEVVHESSKDLREELLTRIPNFQTLVLKNHVKSYLKLSQLPLTSIYARDKNSGVLVALIMYVEFRDKIYLLFPYTTAQGKKVQAMTMLIASLIDDNPTKKIDFEGSSIESIANFYAQFGAIPEKYYAIHWQRNIF